VQNIHISLPVHLHLHLPSCRCNIGRGFMPLRLAANKQKHCSLCSACPAGCTAAALPSSCPTGCTGPTALAQEQQEQQQCQWHISKHQQWQQWHPQGLAESAAAEVHTGAPRCAVAGLPLAVCGAMAAGPPEPVARAAGSAAVRWSSAQHTAAEGRTTQQQGGWQHCSCFTRQRARSQLARSSG
jgi:hypothetical protein